MYDKRLLKYVKAHSGLFTAADIASMWKRSAQDVGVTVALLKLNGILKVDKKGILYAL